MQFKNSLKTDSNSGRPSGRLKKALLPLLIAFVLLVAGGVSFVFYTKYKEVKDNPQIVAQQEVDYLTNKVSKLMKLPDDEQPTIATVQDKEKLKEQPFFKDADNGDKLLIYTKAQKAIIYRDKTNTLINVGPIALDNVAPKTEEATKKTGN